jgi:pimeloyl-ACP methyl ester carboxylesterase
MTPMPAVPASEYDSPAVRAARRLDRARRRAHRRSAWWFPATTIALLVCGLWGVLRIDQYVADRFFWPSSGAQFVEVGAAPADPDATGGTITVVAGGLNRKSGTGPAVALLPALSADGARVFSLVYGNGINDSDIEDKFRALLDRVRPERVDFFGSSMGGDVVLRLAQHLQRIRADQREAQSATGRPADDTQPLPAQVRADRSGSGAPPTGFGRLAAADTGPGTAGAAATGEDRSALPRLGVIFLDCTPLSAADVRDVGRTRADVITALSEALHTDGGVGVRMTAEVLAQQPQWSAGRFPFLDFRWDDLAFKVDQVWREKIDGPGISTQLIKDQYGAIRRIDIEAIAGDLGAGTRIVYFRPEVATDDRVVRVGAAEAALRELAEQWQLDVRIATVPGGHHAGAETNPAAYLAVVKQIRDSRAS